MYGKRDRITGFVDIINCCVIYLRTFWKVASVFICREKPTQLGPTDTTGPYQMGSTE
jgi:hypothetical protein